MTLRQASTPNRKQPSKPADPRRLALRLLEDLEAGRRSLDALIEELDAGARIRDVRDRDLFNALVFGVLRWRGRLDYILARFSKMPLAKIDPPILDILRLALFQLAFLTRIPPSAAVNTAVEMAKDAGSPWVGSFVNAVLRKAAAGYASIRFPDPAADPLKALAATWAFPEWLVQRWLGRYGADATAALCESINAIPPLTLRANTLKVGRGELIAALAALAENLAPTAVAVDGVAVHGLRTRLTGLPEFTQGWFQVQDEAAQLVGMLLDPRPGEAVLDACAGRGGKTGHLAQLTGNRGTVTAMDKNAARLAQLRAELPRLGIANVAVVSADLADPAAAARSERFDRILLDAPCSGLGTLRRNPDIKWTAGSTDLQRHQRTQLALLNRVAQWLKPDGTLVYAVCSPEPEETTEVIKAFLGRNPGFALEHDPGHLPDPLRPLIDAQGFLQTYPHLRYMDGFFAVRLKFKSAGLNFS